MKRYLYVFLMGALIVIIGALLKILGTSIQTDYFYLVGFLFETIAVIGFIKQLSKQQQDN